MQPARQQQMAGLAAEERDASRCACTAAPITAPLAPLMPLGRSTATTGAPLALIASISARAAPSTGAVEAGAEQRIDDRRRRPRAPSGVAGLDRPRPALRRLAPRRPSSAARRRAAAAAPDSRARPARAPRRSRRRRCCRGRPRRSDRACRADAARPRRRPRGRLLHQLDARHAARDRRAGRPSAISAGVSSSIIARQVAAGAHRPDEMAGQRADRSPDLRNRQIA